MALTFNDTTTEQGLVQELRFLSGQDALSIEDATRLLNFALDRYTHLAVMSSGRWKWDDSTNTDRPMATTTLTAGTATYKLDTSHLVIDEVEVYDGSKWHPVGTVDASRDHDGAALTDVYSVDGRPAHYDAQGQYITFYPAPSGGYTQARIWYSRKANHFSTTDTTSAVGIIPTHQDYLPLYAAYRLAMRTNDKNISNLRDGVDRKEREIKEFFGMREMNTPHELVGAVNIPE